MVDSFRHCFGFSDSLYRIDSLIEIELSSTFYEIVCLLI